MTMKNDLILQNDDEGIDGMLPAMPSSSGISSLLAVAFGGGTNSTAMLCGFRERDIKPDLILFADTGGELPETYEHVMEMDTQCRIWWGVGIGTVRKTYQGGFEGLENECRRGNKLPALAYGSRACSMKYKNQPQNAELCRRLRELGHAWPSVPSKKRLEAMGKTRLEWVTENCPEKRPSIRAIGFDAGENHRPRQSEDPWAQNWYPLLDWKWRRQECIEAIARHGLTQPGKSSCFFCPAMKRGEILRLKRAKPEYYARALAIEANATTRSIGRGLGGEKMRWEHVDSNDDAQAKLWDWLDTHDESPIPCGCYDG
jgi:hypothetical protein